MKMKNKYKSFFMYNFHPCDKNLLKIILYKKEWCIKMYIPILNKMIDKLREKEKNICMYTFYRLEVGR